MASLILTSILLLVFLFIIMRIAVAIIPEINIALAVAAFIILASYGAVSVTLLDM